MVKAVRIYAYHGRFDKTENDVDIMDHEVEDNRDVCSTRIELGKPV